MKFYRAILWVSFILIIGEGIILSGLNFAPAASQSGAVLGDAVSAALEEAGALKHPASYYTTEGIARVDLAEVEEAPREEEAAAPVETSSESAETAPMKTDSNPEPTVDRLVEALNTPAIGETPSAIMRDVEESFEEPRVGALMQKNERLYRERLIKELNGVRKEIQSVRDGLDGV